MKRLNSFFVRLISLVCLAVLTFQLVDAQDISSNQYKDLLRNTQLLNWNANEKSLLVNSNQISTNLLDSIIGINPTFLFKNKSIAIQTTLLQLSQQYNSQLPYDWNGGALIPAKGYQFWSSLGVYATIGKHIELQFSPEFVSAQNKNFEGFPLQLNDKAWFDRYKFWNNIDIPQQFGDGNYPKFLPGQSYMKFRIKNIKLGLSTEQLWWGPGYRNSLIMSTNAPGFFHGSIETAKPIETKIGNFEGQIIGGSLASSGYLPPRINSVYNGAFAYLPKENRSRFMTGMIAVWQPKWTKGLYLGMIKASYMYYSDLKNPIDLLPLQGFFGPTATKLEKEGKKSSTGSLFARYVMPKDHAEIYMEYGRKDLSLMPWDLIQTNAIRRAYTFGLRKLFPANNHAHILFAAELTQMQAPTGELIREPDSWYSDKYVRQGYTNDGRPIGAGIGPGSNSQTFEISWVKGLKRIGLQFERVRYQSDYYYYAFEYIQDFRRHWIDISTTIKADWNFKNLLLSAQLGIIRSYNHQWLVIQTDPNNFFQPGNEFLNLAPSLNLRYRF